MSFLQASKSREIVFAVVFSLIASLLVLLPNAATPAKATSHGITYNDQVCDLTTAGYAGDGSAGSPYQITDADGLWEVTDCSVTNSAPAHFELTQDIDASSASHAPTNSPIGYSTSSVIYSFSGILDGNSKVISYSSRATGYASLFAVVQNATIRKLSIGADVQSTGPYAAGLASVAKGENTISEVLVTGSVSGYEGAGGFIGFAFDTTNIQTSFNFADVISVLPGAGGFIGSSQGGLNAELLSNFGNVSGRSNVGGILGAGMEATLHSVRNLGSVSATVDARIGGLIGIANTITISDSINFGEVVGNDSGTGGLVGYSQTSLEVSNSQNRGNVSGISQTGGLVGESDNRAVIAHSSNYSLIQGLNGVGGFVGSADASTVSGSVNKGTISGQVLVGGGIGAGSDRVAAINFDNSGAIVGVDELGGFIGGVSENFSGASLSNRATISGRNKLGGLVGAAAKQVELSEARNEGTVSATAQFAGGMIGIGAGEISVSNVSNFGKVQAGSDFAGGLVGFIASGNFFARSSSNQATVASSLNFAGGLVGDVGGNATVSGVFNSGNVTAGNDLAGGLFGDVGQFSVSDSFNSANVLAGMRAAGLISRAASGSLARVLNSGTVTGPNASDGLISELSGSVTTQSAFTTHASNLIVTSATVSLRTASTLTGWDFTNTWGYGACSENNGLPMLRVFNQVSTYYSDGCYTAPQQSQQQQSQQQTPSAPAPVYSGPVLEAVTDAIAQGSKHTIKGSRLESVVEVSIGGVKQQIVSVTATAIEIAVSTSTPVGVQDIVLVSSFGTLTSQASIEIGKSETTSTTETDLSQSPLVGKTRMLSKNDAVNNSWFEANIEGSGLTRIVCTVTVGSDATLHQRVQARKLAKMHCVVVADMLNSPSIWFQTKSTESRFVGRVFMTFKG